jgi:hypothetical protein
LIDAAIDDLGECLTSERERVFTHPVKDHDGVVYRVADDGEKSRGHVERHVVTGPRQACQRDECIVKCRGNASQGERGPKTDRDVAGDRRERSERGVDPLTLQALSNRGADEFAPGSAERRQLRALEASFVHPAVTLHDFVTGQRRHGRAYVLVADTRRGKSPKPL